MPSSNPWSPFLAIAKLIPTSTQWITFPADPQSSVPVEWTDGSAHSNIYYITQCYWGTIPGKTGPDGATIEPNPAAQVNGALGDDSAAKGLETALAKKGISLVANHEPGKRPDQPKPTVAGDDSKNFKVLGKTILYIAAEFVEDQYCGGVMVDYHIKDLVKKGGDGRWVTMLLDECFHYGQGGGEDAIDRWIVYHPSLVKGTPPPRIFQHRFKGLAAADMAKTASGKLASVAPDGLKQAGEIGVKMASIGIDMLRSAAGHYLHPFLNHYERGVALYLRNHIKVGLAGVPETTFQDPWGEIETFDVQLIATQAIEALLAERDNKKVEQDIRNRFAEGLQYQQSLYGGLRTAWTDKAYSFIWGTDTGEEAAAAAAEDVVNGLRLGSIPASDADDLVMKRLLNEITPESVQPGRTVIRPQRGYYIFLDSLPGRVRAPPPQPTQRAQPTRVVRAARAAQPSNATTANEAAPAESESGSEDESTIDLRRNLQETFGSVFGLFGHNTKAARRRK